MYKSLSDDDPPFCSKGRGKYDYLVDLYYSNEKPLAMGAKVRFIDRVS